MANTLRFKRGLLAGLPSAAVGEPLFTTDTFDLYIGTASGTQKYQKFIASGTTSQLLRGDGSLLTMPIVLSSPANGEVLKYNGTNWVNSSDAGITGSGVAGQVAYFTGATTQGGSNNLFWDASNNRLGIGTNTPTTALHVAGSVFLNGASITIQNTSPSGDITIGNNSYLRMGSTRFRATGVSFQFQDNSYNDRVVLNTASGLSFFNTGGNFHFGGGSDNGLRFQVTGDGYFSGAVAIGDISLRTRTNLTVWRNITGDPTSFGIYNRGTIQSGVTTEANMFVSIAETQAASFTLASLKHYRAYGNIFGASSVITNQFGFIAEAELIGATNNFGFYGNIASGTGRWNLYMNGTAANYLNGSLSIGTTTSNAKLQIQSTSNVEWTDTAILNGGANGDNSGTRIYIRPATNFGAAIYGGRWSSTDRGARLVGISSGGAENSFIHLNGESSIITLGTATSVRATLDASGNLGLGVTPSAWGSPQRPVIQIGTGGGFIQGRSDTESQIQFGTNAYFNGTNWIYINSRHASRYYQYDAAHVWQYAGLGTANNTITWNTGMTLDASGRLLIGGTSTYDFNDAAKLVVSNTSGNSTISIVSGTSSYGYLAFADGTSGTDRYTGAIEYNHSTNYMSFRTNGGNYVMNLTASQNVQIGSFGSDAGYKLDVNGTMRVSGASTLSSGVTLGHTGGVAVTFPGGQAFRSNGGIFIDYGNGGSGDLVFRRGAGVTNTLTLAVADGAATFSSSVTTTTEISARNGDIAIGLDTQFSTPYMAIGWGGRSNGFNRIYAARDTTAGIVISAATGQGIRLRTNGNAATGLQIASDGTTTIINSSGNSMLTFDTSGNLGLGINLTPAYKLDVQGTLGVTGAATFSSSVTTTPTTGGTGFYANGAADYSVRIVNTQSAGTFYGVHSVLNGGGGTKIAGYFTATGAGTNYAAIFDGGNVGIGISTPAQKLDVTGSANSIQARFGNVAGRGLTIGTSAISGTNDAGVVFNAPTATDGTLVFQTSSTDRMTLNSSGLNVATAIAIGTTPDTNLPFKILKNINSTVGIRFENTSTGASAYSAVQFGTDVTGGTAFTNMVYGSSGITESGVYKPNGTSIINTGSGGLNFLAVSQPIRFFTSTGNGTLRAAITNDGDFTQYNGTNPSASTTDAFRMYSADITAGNAAPHFRTENGGIIKLYQQTTGVTSATYIGGAGTTVTDLDTFDGYTIPQIVKALRNAGLLA